MNDDLAMLFDKAKESLDASRLLHEQNFFSFSASRSYYAMFYAAEAMLAGIGLSYSSHGGVIGGFGREFAKTGKIDPKYHRWLIDAQDIRNIGDYGVGRQVTAAQSEEMLTKAGEFIDKAFEIMAQTF